MIPDDHHQPVARAFTLLELLVVLAVIGTILSALLMSWQRSDQGRSLRSAEAFVSAAVAAARGQAAVAGADVLLVVDVRDSASPDYLGSLRLYCVEPAPQGMWLKLSAQLPPAVRLVPPRSLDLPDVEFAPDWPAALGSKALLSTDAAAPPGYLRLVRFTPAGHLTGEAGGWVLAVAERRGTAWSFEDAAAARAVVLSRYGVPIATGGRGEQSP